MWHYVFGMAILLTLVAIQLTAFSGVLSRTFYKLKHMLFLYLCDYLRELQILGGPIGPITFTALSTRSINIQIDRGSDLGLYQRFTIRRDNWNTVCNIPIYATLTDCTDGHAQQGNNHYRIGARYATGSWVPSSYYADTLQQDRMHSFTSA